MFAHVRPGALLLVAAAVAAEMVAEMVDQDGPNASRLGWLRPSVDLWFCGPLRRADGHGRVVEGGVSRSQTRTRTGGRVKRGRPGGDGWKRDGGRPARDGRRMGSAGARLRTLGEESEEDRDKNDMDVVTLALLETASRKMGPPRCPLEGSGGVYLAQLSGHLALAARGLEERVFRGGVWLGDERATAEGRCGGRGRGCRAA